MSGWSVRGGGGIMLRRINLDRVFEGGGGLAAAAGADNQLEEGGGVFVLDWIQFLT